MTMASLDLPGGEGPHSVENIDEQVARDPD